MNRTVSVFSRIDTDTQRRKALAKVYDLLIKLVEEIEESSATPTISPKEETAMEPASTNPVL